MAQDNERELVGWELVHYLMERWNMTEDEALDNLAENVGNVKKQRYGPRDICSISLFRISKYLFNKSTNRSRKQIKNKRYDKI